MNLKEDTIYPATVRDNFGRYQTPAIFLRINYDQKRGTENWEFIHFIGKDNDSVVADENNHSRMVRVRMDPEGIRGDEKMIILEEKNNLLQSLMPQCLNDELLTKFQEAQQLG